MIQRMFVTLDTKKTNYKNVGKINHGDDLILELTVLSDGDMISFDDPMVDLLVKKSDGKMIRQNSGIEHIKPNKFVIEVSKDCVTSPGLTTNQLVINDNGRISTCMFYYTILNSLEEDVIQSISNVEVLEQLDEYVIEARERMELLNNDINKLEEFFGATSDTLVEAEMARNEAEQNRVQSEILRVNNENDRIEADNIRNQNDSIRNQNEVDRSSSELVREQRESERILNEEERRQNESERMINESTRQQNENIRQSNESIRMSNETDRKTQENRRVTAETNRVNAETARRNNENSRISNETERQKAMNEMKSLLEDARGFDERVGVVEDEIEEINTSLDNITQLVDETSAKNDTEKLQNAIDNLREFQELRLTRNYNIDTLNITNKKNIRIFGGQLTIKDNASIKLVGNCDNVEIDNIIFIGDGDNVRGIENSSGQILNNIKIHHNTFKNLDLGVSLNADLGGTYTNSKVYDNILEDIKGTNPGFGYGIHLANAENCEVYNNTIIRCGRHSIYHARGKNNKIYNNTIKEHRKNNYDGDYRSAICIFRDSVNIDVYGNKLIDGYDGGIHILCDGDSKGNMYNINVYENEILDSKNVNASLIIGLGDNVTNYTMSNINIYRNNIINFNPIGSLIKINRGLNVNITDNTLVYANANSRHHLIEIGGTFDINQFDNIVIKNNDIDVTGITTNNVRAIMFAGNVSGTTNILFKDNRYLHYFNDNGVNYIKCDYANTLTNNNIINLEQFNVYYSTSTDGTIPNKFHFKGDKYIFHYAYSGQVYEKICIQAGNPGTWRTVSTVGQV